MSKQIKDLQNENECLKKDHILMKNEINELKEFNAIDLKQRKLLNSLQ